MAGEDSGRPKEAACICSGPDPRKGTRSRGNALAAESARRNEAAVHRALERLNAEHGVHIDAGTCCTRWADERMDYAMAIEYLFDTRDKVRAVGL